MGARRYENYLQVFILNTRRGEVSYLQAATHYFVYHINDTN